MKAAVGDRMVIAAGTVEGPVRDGEVVEVLGSDGTGPFRVRWSDDGRVTLVFPGPDAHVEHLAEPAVTGEAGRHAGEAPDAGAVAGATPAAAPSAAPPAKEWRVDVHVFELEGRTSAQAVLHGEAPKALTARGEARRNPADPDVPEIGDELAVARALHRLADRLLADTSRDIETVTGRPAAIRA
jgi:Domain of unknown function (DUF1876)/Domain of unknown function (DUF1918)